MNLANSPSPMMLTIHRVPMNTWLKFSVVLDLLEKSAWLTSLDVLGRIMRFVLSR